MRMSIGAIAKMKQSIAVMLSLRYCVVICSPKRDRNGARSVARLFEKSSQPSARTSGRAMRIVRRVLADISEDARDEDYEKNIYGPFSECAQRECGHLSKCTTKSWTDRHRWAVKYQGLIQPCLNKTWG